MTPEEAKKLLQEISSRSDAQNDRQDSGLTLTNSSGGGMSVATTALMFEVLINQMEELKKLIMDQDQQRAARMSVDSLEKWIERHFD